MKDTSMLEFGPNARRALDALRRRVRFIVGRLEPVRPGSAPLEDDDSLLRIEEFAVDGPGGALPNRGIDRIVYGA
jgi:hypothetical protein